MARTNKYTSVNFNDIYDKKLSNNNNPLAKNTSNSNNNNNNGIKPKTIISNSRIQGNMLVLTRPTPKPISIPVPIPIPQEEDSLHPEATDTISLRPRGRTGTSPSLPLLSPSGSPSPSVTNKFVPPHLRPGFVGKEDNPVGRPKSGGGYDRRGRLGPNAAALHPPYFINRPSSTGSRPNSTG